MAYDIKSLLNFYKYPEANWQYVSDVVDQTIEALEDVATVEKLEVNNSELFSLLPEEDEFDEEIDMLNEALESDDDEAIKGLIETVRDRLLLKGESYERTREFAEKDYAPGLMS